MPKSVLFSVPMIGLAALLAAGCTTTSTAFNGYDRTTTSSVPSRAAEPPAKQRHSGMTTNDRTGYVTHRVEPKALF